MIESTATRIKTNIQYLNESQLRKYLASEAISLGRGGIKEVSTISGVHRNTISAGIRELKALSHAVPDHDAHGARIRAAGGGRKPITVSQPGIDEALERIIEPDTYGNPMCPLRYTTKSLRNLANELQAQGFQIKYNKVADLLRILGYSLQQNQKMKQIGKTSPDRDAQFRHINTTAMQYLEEGEPVISIDCKKKENVGSFKNNGSEYAPKRNPVEVLDHDFPIPGKGKASPYGVYDINNNEGYVNVGISSDTAVFAANSIRSWWYYMGASRFPNAGRLFITADGGGSNGSRCRLWKIQLQALADEFLMPIEVSHFPPGTSKWNKIEHRMFSQISKIWRAKPLDTLEIIVNLIASTTTDSGLHIECGLDFAEYKTGIKVTDEELSEINIIRNEFCGEWNYAIYPHY
ncbi:MAG: ISAzo13 family transposase [Lachnospiraceae bacterium]|nr:ISAzo13 family transposase [Lachnospiraceae bacterium]